MHNYILFIKTKKECDFILDMLLKSASWNPHAYFHVFTDYLERDWSEFVTYILSQFWTEFVINIIVNIAVNETISYTKVLAGILLHLLSSHSVDFHGEIRS